MKHLRKRTIDRRSVLRGLLGGGLVTIGLPLLEAMLDESGEALADRSSLPLHFVSYFWGNGMIPERWHPTSEGANYGLSEELVPLAKFKDYCSVLTGFQNRCENQITHHEGMTVFNGYSFAEWDGSLFSKAGGPTLDQVIADVIGKQTTFRSLEVGVSKRMSAMDGGTTLFALSHKSTDEPLMPERNPQKVWQALFGSFMAPDDPLRGVRLSVLDAVRADTQKLQNRLGVKDNQRLDAHLEGVAALEKQINALPPACDFPVKPTQTNEDVDGDEQVLAVSKAMNELITYAFACDLTRVASLLFSGGASLTVFADIGQTEPHHANTHDWPAKEEEINEAVIFNMKCFADLLDRLSKVIVPHGGNLLDHSVIFCASDCSEGWTHSIFDQPIIVAGKGGGALVHPGIHYASKTKENATDILLSCLRVFDPNAPSVGGDSCLSTTPCGEILV